MQSSAGPQHVLARDGVGVQERLRVIYRGGIFDRVVIDSRESFDDVQRVGIDLRSLNPFLEADNIDDKGVPFPVTDRVPEPRRIQVLRMLLVQRDQAERVTHFNQNNDQVWRLNELVRVQR